MGINFIYNFFLFFFYLIFNITKKIFLVNFFLFFLKNWVKGVSYLCITKLFEIIEFFFNTFLLIGASLLLIFMFYSENLLFCFNNFLFFENMGLFEFQYSTILKNSYAIENLVCNLKNSSNAAIYKVDLAKSIETFNHLKIQEISSNSEELEKKKDRDQLILCLVLTFAAFFGSWALGYTLAKIDNAIDL